METKETVAWLTRDGGWGAWVRVDIAPTPEADAAAADFFRRACAYTVGQPYNAAHVDEEKTNHLGLAVADYFFPLCEHQMSANLCYGPDHFPREDQM